MAANSLLAEMKLLKAVAEKTPKPAAGPTKAQAQADGEKQDLLARIKNLETEACVVIRTTVTKKPNPFFDQMSAKKVEVNEVAAAYSNEKQLLIQGRNELDHVRREGKKQQDYARALDIEGAAARARADETERSLEAVRHTAQATAIERDVLQRELERVREENHKYSLDIQQESSLVKELRGAWHEAKASSPCLALLCPALPITLLVFQTCVQRCFNAVSTLGG